MTNLHFEKSTADRDNVGDVIIDLHKILTIRGFKLEDGYLLALEYTHNDALKIFFAKEQDARQSLKNIIQKMGGDISYAEQVRFQDRTKPCKDTSDKLAALKALLS